MQLPSRCFYRIPHDVNAAALRTGGPHTSWPRCLNPPAGRTDNPLRDIGDGEGDPMSLESRVLQVLDGPTVARIRFRFPIRGSHVTIAPQTFHHVAGAIRSGRVIVRPPTDLAANVGAQYNDVARTRADGTLVRANTMEINSVAGRLD